MQFLDINGVRKIKQYIDTLLENIETGIANLATVATTGSYNDLTNKPTIPSIDATPTDGSSNVVSSSGVYAALQDILAQMISFDSVSTNQDGTLIITLSNGDTITVDLNHNHPQYPKYVHLEDESDMPASPENDTMYLIDGESGCGGTYTLPVASSSALGGIKTGYTQSGHNYPVVLDTNNAAYVNVPFTNIVYLTSESAMPASPDSNTLYVILES